MGRQHVGAVRYVPWGRWRHVDGVHGCAGCHHVSVRVGAARVQLGRAGERTLCEAWAKWAVGCISVGWDTLGRAVDA